MIDFDFYTPTKIYFGKDKELSIGSILKEHNFKRILIIIGQGSVRKNGLLDKIFLKLNENNVSYKLLEGVRANPTADFVRSNIQDIKEYQPDMILAIGGGSVIDTAKSISVSYYYDGDPFDFNTYKTEAKKALPIGVILTIAASGSEGSNSCVLQDDILNIKQGFNSDLVRPIFAIENPELTFSVGKYQTACGIVDIMMHSLERYCMVSSENEPADGFALTLIKSVLEAGKKVIKDPNDYYNRGILMVLSTLSHNGLTNIGKPFKLPVHQLEHALSGLYPSVSHGAGLAVLYPSWANYYIQYDVDKYDKLAQVLFDLHNEDKYKNAYEGVNKMKEYFASLGMPLTYNDLNINPDIDKLVKLVTRNGTRVVAHHKKPMDAEVITTIFNNCF